MKPDWQDKVMALLTEQANIVVTGIKPETRLIDDLGFDSLDAVEILMALEEEFDIEIPDRDFDEFASRDGSTVKDLIDYIKRKAEKP